MKCPECNGPMMLIQEQATVYYDIDCENEIDYDSIEVEWDKEYLECCRCRTQYEADKDPENARIVIIGDKRPKENNK